MHDTHEQVAHCRFYRVGGLYNHPEAEHVHTRQNAVPLPAKVARLFENGETDMAFRTTSIMRTRDQSGLNGCRYRSALMMSTRPTAWLKGIVE